MGSAAIDRGAQSDSREAIPLRIGPAQSSRLNLTAAVSRIGSVSQCGLSYSQSIGFESFDWQSASTVFPLRLYGPVCGTQSRALAA
jgi:hypothetical protein